MLVHFVGVRSFQLVDHAAQFRLLADCYVVHLLRSCIFFFASVYLKIKGRQVLNKIQYENKSWTEMKQEI